MIRTIATAADKGFFRKISQFIYSYEQTREYENSQFICFDLGFSDEQLDYLHNKAKDIPRFAVRSFDFSLYPSFVKDHLEYYAWKPIIVNDLLNETKGDLIWLDSATILFNSLEYVWGEIEKHGFYTPIGGSGYLAEWTHPMTLEYLEVSDDLQNVRNVCGCMCSFSYQNSYARNLVSEWRKNCLIKECLVPAGANRSNHKFDQPVLTILLNQFRQKYGIHMTKDEVNISSKYPINFLSVRNKIPEYIPIWLNPLSIIYYRINRMFDILINRIKI